MTNSTIPLDAENRLVATSRCGSPPHRLFPPGMAIVPKLLFRIFVAADIALLALCAYSFAPDFQSPRPAITASR